MEDILNDAKIEMDFTQKAPDIWDGIFQEINEEKLWNFQSFFQMLFEYKLQIAVGFAVVFILTSFTINQLNPHGLISISKAEKLANKIDKDVFEAQKKYENVIAEMEQNCGLSELTTENDLAQAYFDKLHLLDQMIMVCKSSLDDNPYNPQIHKQLFFAYNEKIKVYKDLQIINERDI